MGGRISKGIHKTLFRIGERVCFPAFSPVPTISSKVFPHWILRSRDSIYGKGYRTPIVNYFSKSLDYRTEQVQITIDYFSGIMITLETNSV